MKLGGWKISGIEPDPGARQTAKELYQINIGATETLYHFPADSFDAITLWHVMEHMHDLHPALEQFKKLLTKNGLLFIAVPNYESYDAKVYGKYWAAYDVPRHLYHFTSASMRNLLSNHLLRLQAIKPMWFDSFYVSMLSEKYKSGKNNMITASWHGLVSNSKALLNRERCSSLIYVVEQTTDDGRRTTD
jgi:predicted SAM-dependent methyltransferase